MRKKFFWPLVFLSFLSNCKKEDASEPADKFAGNYSYTMTTRVFDKVIGTVSGNMYIHKVAPKKIYLTQLLYGTSPNVYYTIVSPYAIREDSGHLAKLPVNDTDSAIFEENSVGDLVGNVLTINGTFTREGYNTPIFQIVLTKK